MEFKSAKEIVQYIFPLEEDIPFINALVDSLKEICPDCHRYRNGARPGDGGPCPVCGEDMRAVEYDSQALGLPSHKVSGRYWHMKEVHGTMEHYKSIDQLCYCDKRAGE